MVPRVLAAAALCAGCFSRPAFTGDPDAGVDGGTPGDGSITANVIFVSSASVVPAQLGGVTGADQRCAELATAAGLRGQFLAYLSTSTMSARERILAANPRARGWVRPDGRPVADRVDDLALGQLLYPPRLTERGDDVGELVGLKVLTATHGDGTADAPDTCADFQGEGPSGIVLQGAADGAGRAWVEVSQNGCTDTFRLYCVGVSAAEQVTLPRPTAPRLAFLSGAIAGPGATGITALDDQCNRDAPASAGSAHFLAAVPTLDGPVAARLRDAVDTRPWTRGDGVEVLSADLATVSAPPLDATGSLADVDVLFSVAADLTAGDGGSMCGGWTGTTGTYDVGWSLRSSLVGLLHLDTFPCSAPRELHVLCLQE